MGGSPSLQPLPEEREKYGLVRKLALPV